MRVPGVGFPLRRRYGSTVLIQVSLFVLAVILQTACTEENQQEPLAPKVVIRMKAPPKPRPAPPEPMKPPAIPLPGTNIPASGEESGGPTAAAASESKPDMKPGRYRVGPGDTLCAISARDNVYGDAMKWTSLFRLNMERLGALKGTRDLPDRVLPEGTVLTYLTAEEVKANLARLGGDVWVVNVLSSKIRERIVPPALELMRRGFRVYITMARVKGDDWMRLRAGFFDSRDEAQAAGGKIAAVLGAGRPWVAKADSEELREFGGY